MGPSNHPFHLHTTQYGVASQLVHRCVRVCVVFPGFRRRVSPIYQFFYFRSPSSLSLSSLSPYASHSFFPFAIPTEKTTCLLARKSAGKTSPPSPLTTRGHRFIFSLFFSPPLSLSWGIGLGQGGTRAGREWMTFLCMCSFLHSLRFALQKRREFIIIWVPLCFVAFHLFANQKQLVPFSDVSVQTARRLPVVPVSLPGIACPPPWGCSRAVHRHQNHLLRVRPSPSRCPPVATRPRPPDLSLAAATLTLELIAATGTDPSA